MVSSVKLMDCTLAPCPQERVINHAAGSHGVSGIFMKYDVSSLRVRVTEQHMPFWQFLVRLCGIIGGIFSTTGTIPVYQFDFGLLPVTVCLIKKKNDLD